MPKPKWNLNTIYISERLKVCLRPVAQCALTTVVAPMGVWKDNGDELVSGTVRKGRKEASDSDQCLF